MEFTKTSINKVRRMPERGVYDRDAIYAIIDAAPICHVGFVQDGQPFVIPTIHARLGDEILLHGAKASRLLKHVQAGQPICITVTLLDGLVLARSVFNSSMNYRSALIFGHGRTIEDRAEKLAGLAALSEHLLPGRWQEARQPTEQELKATTLVAIAIDSASAKVRTGPPSDDEDDYSLPIWAGVLPIRQQFLEPEADTRLATGIPLPDSIKKNPRA
jgi:nitroimidazol reductase NimA-like FMN-containing flavoprotein (pyridoxamine 5'-phosphate oxidase superfamily)